MYGPIRSSYGRKLVLGYAVTGGAITTVGVATGPDRLRRLRGVSRGVARRVVPRLSPVRRATPDRRRLFNVLQNHVGLLWVAYLLVWLASPVGPSAVDAVGTSMIVACLDAVAKTPPVYSSGASGSDPPIAPRMQPSSRVRGPRAPGLPALPPATDRCVPSLPPVGAGPALSDRRRSAVLFSAVHSLEPPESTVHLISGTNNRRLTHVGACGVTTSRRRQPPARFVTSSYFL